MVAATSENARTYTFAGTLVRARDVEGWNPLARRQLSGIDQCATPNFTIVAILKELRGQRRQLFAKNRQKARFYRDFAA